MAVGNVHMDLSVGTDFTQMMVQEGLLHHEKLSEVVEFVDEYEYDPLLDLEQYEPTDAILARIESGNVYYCHDPVTDRRVRGKLTELNVLLTRIKAAKTAAQEHVLRDEFLEAQCEFIQKYATRIPDDQLQLFLEICEEMLTLADLVPSV